MDHIQPKNLITQNDVFRILKKKSPMNAYIRYRVINSLLVNGGKATLKEMVKSCENALDIRPISKRTIEGDLYAMRRDPLLKFNAPVKYMHACRAYVYSDPDYTIDRFPIKMEEVQTLRFAATILEQFQHIEFLENAMKPIREILETIESGHLPDFKTK